MSQWFLLVGFSAVGGALIVWHATSRQKQLSELLLDQYSTLLAKAREQKLMEGTKGRPEEAGEAELAERDCGRTPAAPVIPSTEAAVNGGRAIR